MIPDELKQSLDRYVTHGIPTGSFLRAVLENDLMSAVCRADLANREIMSEIVEYVLYNVPPQCYGSPEDVDIWIKLMKDRKETSC